MWWVCVVSLSWSLEASSSESMSGGSGSASKVGASLGMCFSPGFTRFEQSCQQPTRTLPISLGIDFVVLEGSAS